MQIRCKCTQKFRDKYGRIYAYRLDDGKDGLLTVNSKMLKNLILSESVKVTNLSVASDGSIVENIEIINKKTEEQEYLDKFLNFIEYLNKAVKTINETSGIYTRGTEYGLKNRVFGVDIYEPGGAMMPIQGDVIYESAKYGGIVKLILDREHLAVKVEGPHSNGFFNLSTAASVQFNSLTLTEEERLKECFYNTLQGGEADKRNMFNDREIIVNTFIEFLDNPNIVKIRLRGIMSKYTGRYSTLLNYM